MYTFILKNLFFCLTLTCLVSCQSIESSTFSRTSPEVAKRETLYSTQSHLYQALSTDTISSISRKYGVSPQEIIDMNNLKRPYILKPGQLLRIPIDGSNLEEMPSEGVQVNSTKDEIRIGPKER